MANRYSQAVILCEDRQQEIFLEHVLVKHRIERGRIRRKVSIKGTGAGEQFVRGHYPSEVKACRSKSTHLSICLTVGIDADKLEVKKRYEQLDDELVKAGYEKRQPSEEIALFVPRRNIETWIQYLQGGNVDEETQYPKLDKEGDCKPSVERFVKECRQNSLPADAPPSLHQACGEMKRIHYVDG